MKLFVKENTMTTLKIKSKINFPIRPFLLSRKKHFPHESRERKSQTKFFSTQYSRKNYFFTKKNFHKRIKKIIRKVKYGFRIRIWNWNYLIKSARFSNKFILTWNFKQPLLNISLSDTWLAHLSPSLCGWTWVLAVS